MKNNELKSTPSKKAKNVVAMVTFGKTSIPAGKIDFTSLSASGKLKLEDFVKKSFGSADELQAINLKIKQAETAIALCENTLKIDPNNTEAKAFLDRSEKDLEIQKSAYSAVKRYKFEVSETEKFLYARYIEYMNGLDDEKNSGESLVSAFVAYYSETYGVAFTNGAFIGTMQTLGLDKASIKQMSKERKLTRPVNRNKFLFMVYSYLAKASGILGQFIGTEANVAELVAMADSEVKADSKVA